MDRVNRATAPCLPWTAAIAGALAVFGCNPTSTTSNYTPITGIEILPSTLLQDLQCGTGDNQVYRYVAVVSDAIDGGPAQGPPIASNVFDCFTTGLFENLPASNAGSQEFYLAIFAYSRASLPSDFTCPGGFSLSGGVCPALEAGPEAKSAQWTATCRATQQQGIPVLAVCGPLVPSNLPATDAAPPGEAAPPEE